MSIFDYFCHRKPERSFFFKGHQFPVCARCTGIYISLFSFFIINLFFKFYFDIYVFILGFLLIMPAGIDGFTQKYGFRESNNALRLVTGLLCGLGICIIGKILGMVTYYLLFL